MTFDQFETHRIATNGTTLAVRTAGRGAAIVLMHGWCGSADSWRLVAPLLAEDHTVIVPDMRGNGDSDKPSSLPGPDGLLMGGYDAANMAADIAGLLDHFGIDRAFVVGHDMGAPVALVFSGVYPARTLGVVYVDEPVIGYNEVPMTAFSPAHHGGYWQFGMNWVPGLAEILYKGSEIAFLRFILNAMTAVKDNITEEVIARHARGLFHDNGIAGWVGWYRAVPQTADQVRHLNEAGAFKAPLMGMGGQYAIPGTRDALAEHLGVEVAGGVIPFCGHLVAEEQPEAMVAMLRPFLAQHAG